MFPEPNERASAKRPENGTPGKRKPTSTRVLVLGWTSANCFGRPNDT